MSEEELNEQYIKNKIQGICQHCMWFDKTIPIINKMLSEAYISGFKQGKFDLKMDLQQKVEQIVNYLDKVVYILKNDTNKLTREQDIAIQKLEEAVFWLTYGIEEE